MNLAPVVARIYEVLRRSIFIFLVQFTYNVQALVGERWNGRPAADRGKFEVFQSGRRAFIVRKGSGL